MGNYNQKVMANNTGNPSIYIPRVFPNMTPARVKRVFEELFKAKCVDRVDMVAKQNKDGEDYKRVFIHLKYWPKSAESTRDKLAEGETVQVVYKEPWYWKCVASKLPKPNFEKANTKGPYIRDEKFVPPPPKSVDKEELDSGEK